MQTITIQTKADKNIIEAIKTLIIASDKDAIINEHMCDLKSLLNNSCINEETKAINNNTIAIKQELEQDIKLYRQGKLEVKPFASGWKYLK